MIRPRDFEVRAFGLGPHVETRRRRELFADFFEHRDSQKAKVTESAGILAGYAVPWRSRSVDLGGFVEEFTPGAFRRSLAGSEDIRALWSHDMAAPLGRRANGTLRLWEDTRGLAFEVDVPETALGNDTFRLVTRGDVSGVSFGFLVPKGGDSFAKRNGQVVRTVHEAELVEVSPCLWPAYEGTSISEGDHRSHRLRLLEGNPSARRARLQARDESTARARRLRLLELTA
jgi:Escherichia/Staphylococcus phage prohead protease